MKAIKPPILQFHLILILIFILGLSSAISQTVGIQSELTSTELVSGETVTLTFSTDTAADIYFFSAEIEYDPEQLEFTSAALAGAMTPGGQLVAQEISPGVHGVSVTRTTPLAAPVQADLIDITFTVRQFPAAGEGEISTSNIRFADSNGIDIDFSSPDDATYTVEKTIVDLSLTSPASTIVTEGESFDATGDIFATGITVDDENTDTLNVWIGVNEADTDPSGWDESKWVLMTFVEQTDSNYFTYTSDVAFQRPVGTYFVALRAEIVNSAEFSYGGIGGLWDGSANPSAQLEIQQQGQFQYTVAEWTFSNDQYTPDRATYPNQTVELELFGASMNGFTSSAANSNGWDVYSEGANYWQVIINTEGLQNLKLSSDQSGGSSTGPRDFKIQHSTDGSNWTDLAGGVIEVGSETQESVDQLPLPASLYDEPSVYIRWVQISDVRVDGDTGSEISSGGTSRIDDILITGQAINPTRVDVWPGDTNRDDTVDENDVIPLAAYWLSEGPGAIYPSIQFEAREVEEWIPAIVTDADANGDGRVDQNDLQPIGLHFGDSVPSGSSGTPESPISQIEIDPLNAGESVDLFLSTPVEKELTGVTFRFDVVGQTDQNWTVSAIEPVTWGEEWRDENKLLQFTRQEDGIFAAAVVHKGWTEPMETNTLMKVTLRSNRDWETGQTVRLLKSTVTSNGQTTSLTDVELSTNVSVSTEPNVTEKPLKTELHANYPNPFNPVTTIPYTLSESGAAQIEVFDAIGRKVADVSYDIRPAGNYSFKFDASALSSGIYLYRLKANGTVQTRKMMLLK